MRSVAVLEKRQKRQAGLLPEVEGPEMEEFLLEVKGPYNRVRLTVADRNGCSFLKDMTVKLTSWITTQEVKFVVKPPAART